MRIWKITFIVSIITLLLACQEQSQSDSELSKLIVGTWSAEYPDYYGEGTYYPNGVHLGTGTYTAPSGEKFITYFHDQWEIVNGELILTPLKDYQNHDLNKVITDKIVSINSKEMILNNSKGEKLVRKRVSSH